VPDVISLVVLVDERLELGYLRGGERSFIARLRDADAVPVVTAYGGSDDRSPYRSRGSPMNGARLRGRASARGRARGRTRILTSRTQGERDRGFVGDALAGKVVVITGSTRGIGRCMAEACAAEGATVVVSSRAATAVDETVEALAATGATVSGIPCDVSREADLEALLDHAISAHGGVDVWVNNAGISLGMRRHAETLPDEIHSIVDVNLAGTMLASRLVVPYLVRRGGGLLVNVSGRGGRGDTAAYTSAYAATKAGVMVFTKSLAAEYKADPVSILVFMPGMVDTDFYGADMQVSPDLEDLAGNIRIVLDAIGTPLAEVGPKLAEVAAMKPGSKTGTVHSVSSGMRGVLGGFKLMGARISGRMKPM
jgi:NAD(P)-dependent dehydrogenase (short-subunit alcohol dehydrogenase family)